MVYSNQILFRKRGEIPSAKGSLEKINYFFLKEEGPSKGGFATPYRVLLLGEKTFQSAASLSSNKRESEVKRGGDGDFNGRGRGPG